MTWQLHSRVHIDPERDAGVTLRGPGPSLCKVMAARYNRVRLCVPFAMLPDFIHVDENDWEEDGLGAVARGGAKSPGAGGEAGAAVECVAPPPTAVAGEWGGWLAEPWRLVEETPPSESRDRPGASRSRTPVEAFAGLGLQVPAADYGRIRVSRVSEADDPVQSPARLPRASDQSWEDPGERGPRARAPAKPVGWDFPGRGPAGPPPSCDDVEIVLVGNDVVGGPVGEATERAGAAAAWLAPPHAWLVLQARGGQVLPAGTEGDSDTPGAGSELESDSEAECGGPGPVSEGKVKLGPVFRKMIVKKVKPLFKMFFKAWKARAARKKKEAKEQKREERRRARGRRKTPLKPETQNPKSKLMKEDAKERRRDGRRRARGRRSYQNRNVTGVSASSLNKLDVLAPGEAKSAQAGAGSAARTAKVTPEEKTSSDSSPGTSNLAAGPRGVINLGGWSGCRKALSLGIRPYLLIDSPFPPQRNLASIAPSARSQAASLLWTARLPPGRMP